MYDDEWRVEVELDDDDHGYGLGERLRAHDLDDEARERLGRRVVVTRDGSRLFLYTGSQEEAREAELVVRELIAADELTASVALTRWHPVAEAWEDASVPLPRTGAEEEEERRRHEQSELQEVEKEGRYDWWVKVSLPSRSDAAELARKLADEGLSVHQRWRYVTVDVLTEELADELAARVTGELPAGAEVWVETNSDDIPSPTFVMLNRF